MQANNHDTDYGHKGSSMKNQAVSEGKKKTLSSCHKHEFLCTLQVRVWQIATADIVRRNLCDNMRVFGFVILNINCIT